VVFQVLDPGALAAGLHGIDPYLALGVSGTLAALVVFLHGRGRFVDDTLVTVGRTSRREVLRHGAHEASFITVWVTVAYIACAVLENTTGFDGTQIALAGIAGVVGGALLGLVPGCAAHIIFTGLYVAGGVPLPALLANSVSQDGDALLPLLALDRRAAFLAAAVTTVPALLVGSLALLILST
jgi:hypothetical protein